MADTTTAAELIKSIEMGMLNSMRGVVIALTIDSPSKFNPSTLRMLHDYALKVAVMTEVPPENLQ